MSSLAGPSPIRPPGAHNSPHKRRSTTASSSSSESSPFSTAAAAVFSHLSRHTRKQLKFVLPGGAVTYLLGTVARLWHLVEQDSGWASISAKASLLCGLLSVVLFLYILLVPWIRGITPNYQQFRQAGELSVVVPLLTALMVLGWPLLSYTLSQWTDLGPLKGTIASSGLYALVLGLLGLVPAPMKRR